MSPIERELLVNEIARATGNAAAGVVQGLLFAVVVALTAALSLAVVACLRPGSAMGRRARVIGGAALFAILLSVVVGFGGHEIDHWFSLIFIAAEMLTLTALLLWLPMAWWYGRERRRDFRPLPPPNRRYFPPEILGALIVVGVVLLAAAVGADVARHRVFSASIARLECESVALIVLVAPLAWLIGRVVFRRTRGSGFATFAGAIAVSACLALAWAPVERRQLTAGMQELAQMLKELGSGQPVALRHSDRWRYGEVDSMVEGFSRFFLDLQRYIESLDRNAPALKGRRFRTAEDIAAMEARLAVLRAFSVGFDDELQRRAEAMEEKIRSAGASMEMRDAMLHGFRTGMASIQKGQIASALAPLLESLERLVAFMKSRSGHYQYDGDIVVFDLQADLERYDELLRAIRRESDRLAQTQAANKVQQGKHLSDFDAWSKDPFENPRPAND